MPQISEAAMTQEAFSDNHLYTMGRKTTINNNQTKQVSLLEGTDVPVIAAPEWRASDAAPIDLGAGADWQNYRYKVFETTVPVKNMAWQGAQSGC